MNKSLGQKSLYGLLLVLVGITANGVAQESGITMAGPAPGCPAGPGCPDIAFMGPPPVGSAQQIGVISTGGMAIALQENAEVVKNQPYQAQAVTEIKQTLADGSHIAQTTTATVARDSDGRTVRIQQLGKIGPWKSRADSSQGNSPTLTTIFDPVANTHTDYTSDAKVAHVITMPPLPATIPNAPALAAKAARGFAVFSASSGGSETGPGPVTYSVQGRADSSPSNDPEVKNPNAKTESLGTKAIESISVSGTKTTNTIPAGTIGNDKDIVITRETWYSPDLKLVVQSAQSDPRFGETTYSLTNIQRNEPDPNLFQVPAGYSIDKVPVHVQTR
jgi:hypothetical protein